MKHQKREKPLLPYPPPEGRVKVAFCVPDDDRWLGAFYGAVGRLTLQSIWGRDANRTAQKIAQVWKDTLYGDGCDMSDCSDFLDCLLSPAGLDALAQALKTATLREVLREVTYSNGFATREQLEALRDEIAELTKQPIAPVAPTDCNDALFGGIRALVDNIDQSITDWFEQSETGIIDNLAEMLGLLDMGAVVIPVIGGFVDWILQQFPDTYAAAMTDEVKDRIACDLMCIVKDTCAIKIEQVEAYFGQRLLAGGLLNVFDDESILNIFEAYAGFDDLNSDTVVDAAFALMVSLATFGMRATSHIKSSTGGRVNIAQGGAYERLERIIRAGMLNEDASWRILCDECPDTTPSSIPCIITGWRLVGETTWRDAQNDYVWLPYELPMNTDIEIKAFDTGGRWLATIGQWDGTDYTLTILNVSDASTIGVFDTNGSGTNSGYLAAGQEYTAAQFNFWDVEVRIIRILSKQ